jgi:hypothetical protein
VTGGKAPKAKGDQHERDVRDYLRRRGIDTERLAHAGTRVDVGDLFMPAFSWFALECKNQRKFELGPWLEHLAERVAGRRWPILVVRRPRHPDPADAYVVMSLETFAEVLLMLAVDTPTAAVGP